VKNVLFIGALLVTTSTSVQANPWDEVQPPPYKNLADAVKATGEPGRASPLNPSCEGMTGDACVRSEQSSDNSRPKPVQSPAAPERGRK
jgi:hypothetical protein